MGNLNAMITIYHNARCSKSREALELVKNSGKAHRTIEYLKDPLSVEQLQVLLDKLNMVPIQLVRKNEKKWKEQYRGKDLSDGELIHILAENPDLMERPILETENAAVIGRPASQIEKFLIH